MAKKTSAKNDTRFVSLADEEAVKKLISESAFQLWDVVHNLTKLRVAKRKRYRVTIFGSARTNRNDFVYQEVRKLGKALAEMNCDVISGGGPGLMQAANEGAKQAKTKRRGTSVGIRVTLPFEQNVNKYVTEGYEHNTFFTRLHHFTLVSDAFVVAPGGIGTALEALMVWQLAQVNHIQGVPLIFAGKMWKELVDWAKKNMMSFNPPLLSAKDLDIPICVESAEEAIKALKAHQVEWKKRKW